MKQRKFERPVCNHQTQLCESCRNYAGGCCWTKAGPDGRIRFEPVPGWTAKKVPYYGGNGQRGFTYEITGCPLYRPD